MGHSTTDVALATNLRDLRRVNRLLGGTDLSRRALAALAGDDRGPRTILDVGTGGADIPAALIADAAQQGVALEVTAMDSRPEMLRRRLRRNHAWPRSRAFAFGSAMAAGWRTGTTAMTSPIRRWSSTTSSPMRRCVPARDGDASPRTG